MNHSPKARILFLHGLGTKPGGRKPATLAEKGYEVLNPALPDEDFEKAVQVARAEFDTHRPDVVVGSSRGGAVAMNLETGDTPLLLLCPAWKHWGSADRVRHHAVIVHGRRDETIPFAHTEELAERSNLSPDRIVPVDDDHRLGDSMEAIVTSLEWIRPGTLQKAIEIAVSAHGGQKCKDGLPYVTHPLTLAAKVNSETEKIAAVLHDVVEDTRFTLADLRSLGFGETVIEAVDLLTHEDGVEYDDYITRLAGNPVARRVKLADLAHNMDITRIPAPRDRDFERLEKYHRAWRRLSAMEETPTSDTEGD